MKCSILIDLFLEGQELNVSGCTVCIWFQTWVDHNRSQDSPCSRRFQIRAGGAGMWCCIGVGWSLIVQGNADACDLTQVLWEGPEGMPLSISERIHPVRWLTDDISGMSVGARKRGKAQG